MQKVIGIDTAQSDTLSLNTDSGTKKVRKEDLTEEKILASAEKYYLQIRKWPGAHTKNHVPDMPDETWSAINQAGNAGKRGLNYGRTLKEILKPLKEKYAFHLNEEKILASAEKYYLKTGDFPSCGDRTKGNVPDMPHETWRKIDYAIQKGLRGLSHLKGQKQSLSTLLEPLKQKYNYYLTEEKILLIAEKYYLQTSRWPTHADNLRGNVPDMPPNETWNKIDQSCRRGGRGLTKSVSLAEFLRPLKEKYGEVVYKEDLTEEKILASAEKYYLQIRKWPGAHTKNHVPDMPDETWSAINQAGNAGKRGLNYGRTLKEILKPLKEKYGIVVDKEDLTENKILDSAEKYYLRTGDFPQSGDKNRDNVPDMPHETWSAISDACRNGYRGLQHLKGKKQTLSTLLEPLKEKYNLTLTDSPLPKEFRRKVVKAPKKLEEKQIGEKVERKSTITFIKGEAFEQLVGLVLLSNNKDELVIPQFCLDVDSQAGFFGMRADYKVGQNIYEIKWGNATDNIIETHDKHQGKLSDDMQYKLILFEKNEELELAHSLFSDLLDDSPLSSHITNISNLMLAAVIDGDKEFLEGLKSYLYGVNIKANQYAGEERLTFLDTELSKFLGAEDKLLYMKENRFALYCALEAYFDYEGQLKRGLISPKALLQESPEAYKLLYFFDGITFKDEMVRDIAVMCELSSSFDNSLLAKDLVDQSEEILVNPVFMLPNGNEINSAGIHDLEDLKNYLEYDGDNFEFGVDYIAHHGNEA